MNTPAPIREPRPQFSRISLGIVLTACAVSGLVVLAVLILPMLGLPCPPALTTVMHIQTVALPLGSACLLGYARIREQATTDREGIRA